MNNNECSQDKLYYSEQCKNKNPDRFYIYIHRKLDGEVFYVGKGMRYRAWSKANRNNYWKNIVQKHGYSVEILHNNLEENAAFDLEIKIIKDLKDCGCKLANLSVGGEGPTGVVQSNATKLIKSEIGKARVEEFRGYAKEQWLNYSENERKTRLAHLDNVRNNEKARTQIAIAAKERWADPDHRSRLVESITKSQILIADAHSERMKNKWSDPEFKKYMIECRRVARLKKLALANTAE